MLDVFIETLEGILGSGMRFAVLNRIERGLPVSDRHFGRVHPSAREDDLVWWIRGCSVPIVLREVKDSEEKVVRYKVIGGVHLSDAGREKFRLDEQWKRGEVKYKDDYFRNVPVVLNLC